MRVLVLNGPNLARLGAREPEVYGTASYDDLVPRCTSVGAEVGLDVEVQLTGPLVEVHLTNPAARERFRHTSVVAGVATGTVSGFGLESYALALRAIAARATL